MAVVKMNKFTAIGIDTAKASLMTQLMELGAVELNSQDSKLVDEEWTSLVAKEKRDSEVLELESKLSAIDNALKTLSVYDTAKAPMFNARTPVTESAFVSGSETMDATSADIRKVLDLNDSLRELKSGRNKRETTIIGLTPWKTYQIPLEVSETNDTYIIMGIIPPELDISLLKGALEEATELFELSFIGSDQEQQYISLIYMKEEEEKIRDTLKQFGFTGVFFKDLKGSATENITRLEAELVNLAKDIEDVEKNIANMMHCKESFQMLYDYLSIEQDMEKGCNNMLVTKRAFYIDGWVPAPESENLANILKEQGCQYEITAPEKDEETPVLLKNNAFITPVETITNLYDTPSSKELDPTPIFALFYICFFGIMFADIAYGLILATGCFLAVRSGKLEGNIYKFIKQLGYCGVSATIWGVIFGSFFGNLIPVVSETFFGRALNITPLWIDPIENAMTMLAFACIFGVVHLFVALGVKAYGLIREGRVVDAVCDVFLWYFLLVGLGLLLGGEMLFAGASVIGKWLSIIGAGGIVILPVFTGKGVGKAVGLWKLYGITNYLADILSYARLFALCLAGTVIAQVFNSIAALFGTSIIGIIMFIIVVVVAHVFNFLLSGLGAFVHAIRLQYVEFFGKFFEGKGTAFQPFMKNTKYVKIIKEEI